MENKKKQNETDNDYMSLLTKFEENVLNSKFLNNTNLSQSLHYEEKIARVVATFCLENNIKAEKFNSLFRYHLVELLKEKNPDIPNVQISARTGINRRGISSLSKSSRQSKDMLVLSYLKSYCQTHNTTLIPKKGHCNTFESICHLSANGTLTSTSIAKELLRQGHLIDKGSRYQIVLKN